MEAMNVDRSSPPPRPPPPPAAESSQQASSSSSSSSTTAAAAPSTSGRKRKQPSADGSKPKPKRRSSSKLAADALASPNWAPSPPIADKSALLLTKSMKRSELHALAAKGEITFVSGPFTKQERDLVGRVVEEYMRQRGMTLPDLQKIIIGRGLKTDFWQEITPQIPGRPLEALRNHIQRRYRANARKGPWTPEEDRELIRAHGMYGNDWKQISTIVDRNPDDCRDRWKTQLAYAETRQTGPWSEEEIRKLRRAMREVCEAQKQSLDDGDGVLWNAVSDKMGHTRSSKQCRNKWVDDLLHLHKARVESREKWTPTHALTLARAIVESSPTCWEDIPWKRIQQDPILAVYAPHRVRNIFRHYLNTVEPQWRSKNLRDALRNTLVAVEDWERKAKMQPGLSESTILSEEFMYDSDEENEQQTTTTATTPSSANDHYQAQPHASTSFTDGNTTEPPQASSAPASTRRRGKTSNKPPTLRASAQSAHDAFRPTTQPPATPSRSVSVEARARSAADLTPPAIPGLAPRDASASAREQQQLPERSSTLSPTSAPPNASASTSKKRKSTEADVAQAKAEKSARKEAKAARKAARAAKREAKAARRAVEALV